VASKPIRILLAAGGTAGHVEPAIAVGKWLHAHYPEISIEFLGTPAGIENALVQQSGFNLKLVSKAPLPRKLSSEFLTFPFLFLRSIAQTFAALKNVDAVVGFGGYVSASAYCVAAVKRIPIFVHEANALPGFANRLGAVFAKRVMIAFNQTKSKGAVWNSAQCVGIPLRREIIDASRMSAAAREGIRLEKAEEWGFDPKKPIVVVFGGSQGAAQINRVIKESLGVISTAGIQVVHAVGKKNELPESSIGYKALPYFNDMEKVYASADLVIARSGAVTCYELGIMGCYALLVPLPIGNGEQGLNGEVLVNAGAASIIRNADFTSRWLGENLIALLTKAKNRKGTSLDYPLNAAELIGEQIVRDLGVANQ
jgi:UDP-N-acetylglucosamine--N-acetylmuramyl-(pentapeptide) pyrophosphoryl-undecaprenol N-acetylglucosamine transferase